jgi:hypothetical protein
MPCEGLKTRLRPGFFTKDRRRCVRTLRPGCSGQQALFAPWTGNASRLTSLPRKASRLTSLPRKASRLTSLPRKASRLTSLPRKASRLTSLPRKASRLTSLPRKASRLTSLPRKASRLTSLPRKASRLTSLPRRAGAVAGAPRTAHNEKPGSKPGFSPIAAGDRARCAPTAWSFRPARSILRNRQARVEQGCVPQRTHSRGVPGIEHIAAELRGEDLGDVAPCVFRTV